MAVKTGLPGQRHAEKACTRWSLPYRSL
uniref:Uncharacterized protein n=1 Tax=Arundo donax TaxID=35708 RepID=A0A0A8Z213_ARUDO